MNRRDLIVGVAGLAGTHALSTAAQPVRSILSVAGEREDEPGAHAPGRKAPSAPIRLANGELEVVFDLSSGLPHAYRYKGQRLWGETGAESAQAIVCKLQPREYQKVSLKAAGSRLSRQSLEFAYRIDLENRPAARFHLRYALAGSAMQVTLESVTEAAGFELIEVVLPRLVAVCEEDGPAWMAEGRNGGSFVRLEQSRAYQFPDDEYFGRISTELPIGMVGQGGIGCVMEVTAWMDGTETEIRGAEGHRQAILGTVMTHRVHGGRCYNMNDGESAVCGNVETPNLMVGQMPRTRFDFFPCAGLAQPWMAGAKILRARMPQNPSDYFSDRFLYIVAGKRKIDAEPGTTFAQSGQLVKDIAALTDHAPQTAFISGWAYDGQDTGFPSEDKINSSLGSYGDLRALIETGKQWNANVTLNVNYDDAYKSSPLFDEAFIARRPDGAIWKSRAWDDETSYITGMAKYMEGGWGSKRIGYTVDRYRIEHSILIDAMSWFAVRNDWDRQHPASGYKNLVDGKFRVVDEFRRRGVEVTSEKLRYPFIGKMALTMNGPGGSDCPFGGEAVPLLPTIYRGAAIWGGSGDGKINPQQEIFWNTRSALWFQADTDRALIADFYYLVVLPFGKLHKLAVEDYESAGTVRRLMLENRSEVRMDTANGSYAATIGGVEIARDDATFCPIDEHRIAFYARTARTLRSPLPAGWKAEALAARTLTLQGRTMCKVQCVDGMIVVEAEAKRPVIVYSSEKAIPAA
jgi:hypothetical protein